MDAFRTLSGPVEAELKEKGSRFLARAVPVRDRAGAEAWFRETASGHRDATHVVPAFSLHDGTVFASDAGEPAGSAGPALLHAIAGAGLTDVAAVVVRWFGGTKLGVGGLARAYSASLALALDGAATVAALAAVRLRVSFAHARTAAVLRSIAAHGGTGLEHAFADQAAVTFTLPADQRAAFGRHLRDATQAEVVPQDLGATVIYR